MNKLFLIGLLIIAVIYVSLCCLFPKLWPYFLLGVSTGVGVLTWYVIHKSEVPIIEEDTDVKFRGEGE